MTDKDEPQPFIGQGTAAGVDVLGGIETISIKVGDQVAVIESHRAEIKATSATLKSLSATMSGVGTVTPAAGKPKLIVPPWIDLTHWLGLVSSKRFYADVVKPTLADAQHDYIEAMRLGRDNEATMAKWRGLWWLLVATVATLLQPIRSLTSWFSK